MQLNHNDYILEIKLIQLTASFHRVPFLYPKEETYDDYISYKYIILALSNIFFQFM